MSDVAALDQMEEERGPVHIVVCRGTCEITWATPCLNSWLD